MNLVVALALVQAAGAVEPLPVDEMLAAYDAVLPELREREIRIDAEIGAVGRIEPGWEGSGISAESALTAGKGNAAEHLLGEWEVGGHGVAIPGDRPLVIDEKLRRYSVRGYSGPVDYHTYHRAAPGIVFHTLGSARRIGNAECQTTEGVEVISRVPWQDWPAETALKVFSAARMTRDDRRTYCIIYDPLEDSRYAQLAYTPEGEPYVAVNEDPQTFVVSSRAEAVSRLFD